MPSPRAVAFSIASRAARRRRPRALVRGERIAPYEGMRIPVAADTASTSSTSEAASPKSPLEVQPMPLPSARSRAGRALPPHGRAATWRRDNGVPALHVPQRMGRVRWRPVAREWSDPSPRRETRSPLFRSVAPPVVAVRNQQREAVEQEVGRAHGSCAGGAARTARATSRERPSARRLRPSEQRRPVSASR